MGVVCHVLVPCESEHCAGPPPKLLHDQYKALHGFDELLALDVQHALARFALRVVQHQSFLQLRDDLGRLRRQARLMEFLCLVKRP